MPKLPPPPRIAQKRSSFSRALAVTRRPVGQHHFGGEQVVQRETVFAHQPAQAAAQGEPRHAGDRDKAAGSGQPVRLERVIHLAPVASALHADGARRESTVMPFMCDRSITKPSSHTAKPATLWPVPRTETSSFSWRAKFTAWTTSLRAGAPGDECGPAVDRGVEYGACGVIRAIARDDQLALEAGFQLVNGRRSNHRSLTLTIGFASRNSGSRQFAASRPVIPHQFSKRNTLESVSVVQTPDLHSPAYQCRTAMLPSRGNTD